MLDRHAMREVARFDVLGGAIEIGDGPSDPASKDKSSHECGGLDQQEDYCRQDKAEEVEETQLTEGSENPAV